MKMLKLYTEINETLENTKSKADDDDDNDSTTQEK